MAYDSSMIYAGFLMSQKKEWEMEKIKLLFYGFIIISFVKGQLCSQVVNNNRLIGPENRQKETHLENSVADYSVMVDCKGDLNLKIPLLELPGKNISYPLMLRYQNGIHWAQAASEVGLGFSLNLPCIERVVNTFPDDKNHHGLYSELQKGYFLSPRSNPLDNPDTWTLQLPDFSAKLYYLKSADLFVSSQNSRTLTIEYDPYDTTAVVHTNPNNTYSRSNFNPANLNNPGWLKENEHLNNSCHYYNSGIERFVVINQLTGMKYVFGAPLRIFGEVILPYMTADPHGDNIIPFEYYYKWNLLYILGPDYVSSTADPFGEPDDDCRGGWIKFEYSDVSLMEFYYPGGTTDSRFKQSVMEPAYAMGTIYNSDVSSTSVTDLTAYYKEKTFVTKIVSNSHELVFHFTDREDDNGQFGYYFARDNFNIQADPDFYRISRFKKISRISLRLKNTDPLNIMREYAFLYDYSLWGLGTNNTGLIKQGRLTLRKMYTMENNKAAGNNISSQKQTSFSIDGITYYTSHPPIVFDYNGINGSGWITYDVDEQNITHYYYNPDMFSTSHFWEPVMKQSWTDYRNDRNGYVWFNSSTPPNPNQWAWSLKSISASLGLKTLFRYESDQINYDYYFNSSQASYQKISSTKYGDGARIKEIVYENGDLKYFEDYSYGDGYVHILGTGSQTGSGSSCGGWYVSYDQVKKEKKSLVEDRNSPGSFIRVSSGSTVAYYYQPHSGNDSIAAVYPRFVTEFKNFYLGLDTKKDFIYAHDTWENYFDAKFREENFDSAGKLMDRTEYQYDYSNHIGFSIPSFHGTSSVTPTNSITPADPDLLQTVKIYVPRLVRQNFYEQNPGYLTNPADPPDVLLVKSVIFDDYSMINEKPRIIREKIFDSRRAGNVHRQKTVIFGFEDPVYGQASNNLFQSAYDLSTVTVETIYDTLISGDMPDQQKINHLLNKNTYVYQNYYQNDRPQVYLQTLKQWVDKSGKQITLNNYLIRDKCGRVLKEQDANGNITIYFYGDNQQPFNNTAPGLNNYFLTGEQHVNGIPDNVSSLLSRAGDDLAREFQYDPATGKILSEIDENGVARFFDYYPGGKIKTIRRFDHKLIKAYEYGFSFFPGNMINYIAEKIYNDNGTVQKFNLQYFDGCGNLVQKQNIPALSSAPRLLSAFEFSPFNEVTKVYRTCSRVILSPEFGQCFDSDYQNFDWLTEFEYWKNPRRQLKIQTFNKGVGNFSQKQYNYVFAGNGCYYTCITDETGNQTIEYRDFDDNVVKTFNKHLDTPLKDLNDGRGYTTVREYDPLGHLLKSESGMVGLEQFCEYLNNPVWTPDASDWFPEYLFLGTDYLKIDPRKTRFEGRWEVVSIDSLPAFSQGGLKISNPQGSTASRNFWISPFEFPGEVSFRINFSDYREFPNFCFSIGELIPNVFYPKISVGFSNNFDEPLHSSSGSTGFFLYFKNFNESSLNIGEKIFLRDCDNCIYSSRDNIIYQLPPETENQWINLTFSFTHNNLRIKINEKEFLVPSSYDLSQFGITMPVDFQNPDISKMNMIRIEASDLNTVCGLYVDDIKVQDGPGNEHLYSYDLMGRIISQKNTTTGLKQLCYDPKGNLRFSQDQKMAKNGMVYFTNYDFYDRPVGDGLAATDFSTLDGEVKCYPFEQTPANKVTICQFDAIPDLTVFPWNQFTISINAADFHCLKGRLAARCFNNNQVELISYTEGGLVEKKFIITAGLSNTWIYNYYNLQNQLIKQAVIVGSKSFYHFYEYDDLGRLSRVYTSESKYKPKLCEACYIYSGKGLLDSLKIGEMADNSFRSSISYSYNARNWLTDINRVGDNARPFAAHYEYLDDGNIEMAEYYNQLISGVHSPRYCYQYSYDFMKRLVEANYSQFTTRWEVTDNFDVMDVKYDAAGNMKSLRRYNSTSDIADELVYTYDSRNRLDFIADQIDHERHIWDIDSSNFAYDENGNSTLLWNVPEKSGLVDIHYDHRNLPLSLKKVGFQLNSSITYRYNAEGQRIYKKIDDDPAEHYIVDGSRVLGVFSGNGRLKYWNIFGKDLLGRYEFIGIDERSEGSIPVSTDEVFQIDDALNEDETVLTEKSWEVDGLKVSQESYTFESEGMHDVKLFIARADSSSDTLSMMVKAVAPIPEPIPEPLGEMQKFFYIKDHLGSIRVVMDQAGHGIEGYDYYPFGLKMPGRVLISGQGQSRDFFTGKERDAETVLDYFGARYYDARIARWLSVDLLNQYSSPYLYCGNNPILLKDSNGLFGEDVHFDLTLYMAVMIMGVSAEEAASIAFADNYTDFNPDTNPMRIANWSNKNSRHFESAASRNAINALEGHPAGLSSEKFGEYLHSYQDVNFAHHGYKALGGKGIIGHSIFLHEPDRAVSGNELKDYTVEMIKGVYELMKVRNGGVANITLEELLRILEEYVAEKGTLAGIQRTVGGRSYQFYDLINKLGSIKPKGAGKNKIADFFYALYPQYMIVVDGIRYY